MIEHIRLSEKAKQQLIVIKRKTGIENWNVLCRWALCLSLAEKSIPPKEDIALDSSVEMTWRVFSGEQSETLASIIKQRIQHDGITLTSETMQEYFKLHLHRGISFLSSTVNGIDSIINKVE